MTKNGGAIGLAVLVSCLATSAEAQGVCLLPGFPSLPLIETEANPVSVTSADFDRDGHQDLAVVTESGGLHVLLGQGKGTFAPRVDYSATEALSSMTSADLNGDGHVDLAVTARASARVGVMLNRGDGTFGPRVDHGVGSAPASIATADFNGDGRPDLAVAASGSGSVSVLLGRADGTFDPAVNHGVGTTPRSVTTADFNGDGDTDLAVANSGSGTVSVLPGRGDVRGGLQLGWQGRPGNFELERPERQHPAECVSR
ncbi:MAG: VCBS repeat-containing protein [Myxococcaceae bacterium]